MNYTYDKQRFLTALKERKGELAYDLKRAEARVLDIKRDIAENDIAITNIEADIQNAKGTIE